MRILVILVLCFCFACNSTKEGEELAKVRCSSCHVFPEPSLLPTNVWQHSTLPYMGILMGVQQEIDRIKKPLSDYTILSPGVQSISNKEWEKIKEYYLVNSPKKLDFNSYEKLESLNSLFDIEKIEAFVENGKIPNFTALKVDTLNSRIIAGDQSNRVIWFLDQAGRPLKHFKNEDALTDIDISFAHKNEYLFTFIGTTTQANPDVKGYVAKYSLSRGLEPKKSIIQADLQRPIVGLYADLNQDNINEILIAEFGFKEGGLSFLRNGKKQVLSSQTGATKMVVTDVNNDGLKDIVALIAQGDERIVLFVNNGNLNFKEIDLVSFPPIYGCSSFDFTDIDNDGLKDLIVTAGDNADFTTVLKPYHGVYVYKNLGGNKFKKAHFFQQNGATKIIVADFDNDNDKDLVSIALFPDVDNRPEEGFIYMENQGENFKLKTLPINHLGRWSVMDAADIDHDGDLDLVLGSHPVAKFPAGFDQNWKKGSGLIILKNKTHD